MLNFKGKAPYQIETMGLEKPKASPFYRESTHSVATGPDISLDVLVGSKNKD